MEKGIYKHNKTGNLYEVIQTSVINATNSNDGQLMVLYFKISKDDMNMYIREREEFLEKFTKCEVETI